MTLEENKSASCESRPITHRSSFQELDPEVVAHLHGIGLPVSTIALPWIYSAFAGHLRIEEVLLLWDRVLGLDSLLPLPLMAVAIICFRYHCAIITGFG